MAGLTRAAAVSALLICITGCTLITLKSPEKPLSSRDLNARVLSQEFAIHFDVAVEQAADEIAAATDDPTVRLNALRWKIAASGASERAASQLSPMLGLLDIWSLTVQMADYLAAGNGAALFRAQQPRAVMLSTNLAHEAEELARGVAGPQEFDGDKRFIEQYARENPIQNLNFARGSLAAFWMREKGGKAKLVDSLGTVPEAMAEASGVLRIYGDTLLSQTLWRAELAAQESGISGKDAQAALKQLDGRLARLSAMADATPAMVNGVVRNVSKRADASWMQMMGAIHTERAALTAAVSAERQAAVDAMDVERAATAADAERITHQIISDAGRESRRLVREALSLAIVLAIVILGLPFTAGYFVGRARRRDDHSVSRISL